MPAASAAADDAAKIRSIVDTRIHSLMAEQGLPGMAVAVTVDGRISVFNYGVASKEKNTPVTDTTLFELGSISKAFTGTLGMYAQVLGKLSLEDHPGKYMPQLKGSAIDKASLLHLATYTAGGLPLQFPDDVSSDAEQINAYYAQWKPNAAPGAQRTYSNPSIGLFGQAAALSLKSSFSDAMETRIFPPLGLKNTFVKVPESAMGNYAWGYYDDNTPLRVDQGPMAFEAYGVKSTAADMIRFVQANIDPSQLKGPIRRAIEGTQVGHFQVGDMAQGLGWEQYSYPVSLERLLAGNSRKMSREANPVKRLSGLGPSGPMLFNKTGSTSGFSAYTVFVPAKKIGIVMLANRSYSIEARIQAAHAIMEQLAPMVR